MDGIEKLEKILRESKNVVLFAGGLSGCRAD